MIRTTLYTILISLFVVTGQAKGESYPIVDTGQNACFNNSGQIDCPAPEEIFDGQDAQYKGHAARYQDNGDGTVSDLVTGLMWVKERGYKISWSLAMSEAATCRVGGYSDWRAPTIKELYSLIDFNGWVQGNEHDSIPFINTRYFDFKYGDPRIGERLIDSQDWSSTKYMGTVMGGEEAAFGVNFADGRIKAYPINGRGQWHNKYIRYVRGTSKYGKNSFVDKGDGTVEDKATGLIWQQKDSRDPLDWEYALNYCSDLDLAGRTDWRLPSAKELQSIVDYSRSPESTDSAAIDPIFSVTDKNAYFWTSTTHLDGPKPSRAVYIAFGRAMGYFAPPRSQAAKRFLDVHGAGAQRSDPKAGNAAKYSQGQGPQGDDIRILNAIRCVAGGGVEYYEPISTPIPDWTGVEHPGEEVAPLPEHQSGYGPPPGEPHHRGGHGPMDTHRMHGQEPMLHHSPPPEAIEACRNLVENKACTVDGPRGALSGLCRDTGELLVCVPVHGRPGVPPHRQ